MYGLLSATKRFLNSISFGGGCYENLPFKKLFLKGPFEGSKFGSHNIGFGVENAIVDTSAYNHP